MIPRQTIEEILRRNNIKECIERYVELRRAGSNYVGLCPFHSEKSPSFTVFEKTDSFHCFGCGAGGDVITFIKKIENIDYVSAVKLLGERAGVEIRDDSGISADTGPSRERIRKMNTDAAKFFHACLLKSPDAAKAREYLEKRELDPATVNHFYLGYAPGGRRLYDHLKSLGYSEEEMSAGFLVKKNDKGRWYDMFFGRVIFPIVDTSKNIIAFGGRVLDDSKPKYLNTSDTPAFRKSRNLFALNYAKDYCSEYLIVCEGYMDVVTMHKAGFPNSVATLGTAITDEHARIIARYTKKVILSYDSDQAGINATNRAMSVLSNVGVDVRVLRLSGAKDPDEYIKKFGADRFRRVIENSETGFDYKLSDIMSRYSIAEPAEKIRAVAEVTSVIASYRSSVERDLYAGMAAEKLGISANSLLEDVGKAVRSGNRREMAEQVSAAHSAAARYGDRINTEAVSNVGAVSAEETILGLLLLYPEHRDAVASGRIKLQPDDFVTSFSRKAYEKITELTLSEGGFLFSLLGQYFEPDEMGRLESLSLFRSQLSENGEEVLVSSIEKLRADGRRNPQSAEAGQSLADSIAEKRRKLEESRKKRGL